MSSSKENCIVFYSSDNLDVYVDLKNFKRCIVTFSNWTNYPHSSNNKGFARDFLKDLDVSAVYVVARGNHWWQHPNIIKCMQKLSVFLSSFDFRIVYGSSMGGYGALIFSDILKADRVIAFSPQYSIDRKKASFEDRWKKERNNIKFIFDDMKDIPNTSNKYIFHTVEGNDNRQVKLFKSNYLNNFNYYELPFSGHPCGPYLKETGVLSRLLKYMIFENNLYDEDILIFILEAEKNKYNSPTFLFNYIRNLKNKDNDEFFKTLEYAIRKFPDSDKFNDFL